ncbi:hypothetical protein DPX16_6379 [Anabarilius grahami]|uniref:DUF6451 domain-containing protein n=1 Tax=Anabarilius grahami TaxID=495550 RepID=A0A3N0YVQ0_ANAGA|nr:hypothetical protein DPX16_6379 [Anabarilius grahami]
MILCRIGKASAVFQRLKPIWEATTISIKTKLRLFNSIVIPTAIYAAETWKTSARIVQRLKVFQQQCLQQIMRVSHRDRITNDEVHCRTDTRPLRDVVTERRLRFAGHVLRLPPNRHAKKYHPVEANSWQETTRATASHLPSHFHRGPPSYRHFMGQSRNHRGRSSPLDKSCRPMRLRRRRN